jgi:hypothetical protein
MGDLEIAPPFTDRILLIAWVCDFYFGGLAVLL